jgi:hypothetical protein
MDGRVNGGLNLSRAIGKSILLHFLALAFWFELSGIVSRNIYRNFWTIKRTWI